MGNWLDTMARIEALEDIRLDAGLVQEMQQRYAALHGPALGGINFYTPTFKAYATSEIGSCGKNAWPAVSVTGAECSLSCDHCKAKILEPMIPARSPEALWHVVNEQIEAGAQGMLLTGGSNHRNEVEYDAYYPAIRRIKDEFPHFKIALHTALVTDDIAYRMEDAGIDAAMMDVIGSQDTISQVYHLRRNVDDFERSLAALVATRMKVVPHIVIGLHYGNLLGEWNALEMIRRHLPAALVLVVAMPFYAPKNRPFRTPDSTEVGHFFIDAREALPGIPLLLGCARPTGRSKSEIDSYAVMAGLNGIAHPADGMVELALRMERKVRVTPACCSIAVGDEVLALENDTSGIAIDPQRIIEQERRTNRLAGIKVVTA